MVSQKPREIAARILLRHATGRSFLEEVVDQELAHTRLRGPDRGLVQEMCYGTLRWRATLDWLIDRQTRTRPPSPPARILLRLGLYQLLWLDRVPPHAAVHETVEAALALGMEPIAGFVNAVLRAYGRTLEPTRALLREQRLREPALGWSHPEWLVQRWTARLGQDHLQALLEWDNTPAPTYARANLLKCDPAKLIQSWRAEGVDYDFVRMDWFPENLVFHLRSHPPLERLGSFKSGGFYVQDPSTLMPVHLLAPTPGERILDLCAAPGGKATYIAQVLDNDGQVVATEPDPRRRERLRENCERLGADVTVAAPNDAVAGGPFDAVLLDAPCSNTGVLRRRLDARWRLQPSELARSQKLQAELLANALTRLRPGGRLVYSTCSLEPEENEAQVERLLKEQSGLELVTTRLLMPWQDKVDGAFAAVLRLAG